MEIENENKDAFVKQYQSGRVLGGMVIVIVGVVLLIHKMGVMMPDWLFTWPMLLIVIGTYAGAKHRFRSFGWMIPIAIGAIFLLENAIPDLYLQPFFWPVLIIVVGMIMIFKPRRSFDKHHRWAHMRRYAEGKEDFGVDGIDAVAIFGGVSKKVISKNFKGGEVTSVFGGTDINFMQADINGTVVLEANQVFGGTKLIVPSNWKIQTDEIVAIFGGVEDKTVQASDAIDHNKVLVIRGVTVFGGIEIKSY